MDIRFFYEQSKFRKQAGACLRKKLVQAQSMLALCLFIKILLGVCLRKRLDKARNMIILEKLATYKTRNTGTGDGVRGTRRMGGMLYSGECRQTFVGMSPNIPGNVAKHSGECH